MKTFHNPLERVLGIRRIQQRRREAELAAAAHKRDEAQAVLDAIEARRRQNARADLSATPERCGSQLLQRDRFGDHQRQLAKQQNQTVKEQENHVTKCINTLISARREVRILETHRERLHKTWRLQCARAEQATNDDIVNARTSTIDPAETHN